jgi:hypothetical protein
MKNKFLLILFILVPLLSANSVIRNVPGNYSGIQTAINLSNNGDTILVEPGTYFENITFRGKKVVLTSRFYISNDLNYISNTIINGSNPVYQDTASCVIFRNGEDSTAVIQGFTITGGGGTAWTDEHGAGVYREGGGILTAYTSPVIRHNIIKNNVISNLIAVTSTGGAGIRAGDGNPKILNNIITNNSSKYGPGVVLNYCGCNLRNNVICGNYGAMSYHGGSGLWINGNSAKPRIIINNTIVNNSSLTGTGGILVYTAAVTIKNNIVWNNVSPAGAQFAALYGGSIIAQYCDIMGGYTGTGNISSAPDFGINNFYLSPGSPCIDAGDTASEMKDPEDTLNPGSARYPAFGTLRNDIGAYGGPYSITIAENTVDIKKYKNNIPGSFILYQNFPNPFNPETKIRFDIPSGSAVNLNVYDITGKLIRNILNKNLLPGTYEVMFNAEDLSGGMYFLKLTAGTFSGTRKMMLVK